VARGRDVARGGGARVITLYPAIDLQDGRAVRLVRGDFATATVFNEDPVAQARAFAEEGATALHVVDLDGAREGRPAHAPVIAAIAAAFPGQVHLGGGLRSRAAIETALATGVHRVVLGTAALDDGELLRWAIGRLADRVVVALDARDGMVATHGWTRISDRSAIEVATELVRTGVRHLLYTDISRDGTLEGPNYRALRALAEAAPPLNIITSGGVGSPEDLRALRDLDLPNLAGVIVGRALYEGRLTVPRALEILDQTPR
jgi:phosphoribosylformimino-5-aminoimidazole carboxamide ribotide isomerase